MLYYLFINVPFHSMRLLLCINREKIIIQTIKCQDLSRSPDLTGARLMDQLVPFLTAGLYVSKPSIINLIHFVGWLRPFHSNYRACTGKMNSRGKMEMLSSIHGCGNERQKGVEALMIQIFIDQ